MRPLATGPSGTEQEIADDRTLRTARLIAAPPEQVYPAFVAPERLARWWGPKGFRSTFQVFDPRPGGTWRFVMHGPNGRGLPQRVTPMWSHHHHEGAVGFRAHVRQGEAEG